MLTERLQQIKIEIHAINVRSFHDNQILEIINNLDKLESIIADYDVKSRNKSKLILEAIIRPEGDVCLKCGRTL